MAYSRRPARFKRPDFKQTEPISEENLKVLKAAAARVFINKPNPAGKSSKVNTEAAGCANAKDDETEYENGVELLAEVAARIRMEDEKKEKRSVGKKAT